MRPHIKMKIGVSLCILGSVLVIGAITWASILSFCYPDSTITRLVLDYPGPLFTVIVAVIALCVGSELISRGRPWM